MTPRSRLALTAASLGLGLTLGLTACSGADASLDAAAPGDDARTVTITGTNGEVTVPAEPERVVALDNTSFETLRDWGVTPVAVPKGLLPREGFEDWLADDDIADVGTHREPDLEAVAAAEPDVIIGGYRFSEYTDDLEQIAPVVDVAGSDEHDGGYVASLEHQAEQLGLLFDREQDAAELVAGFEQSERAAAEATDGETVFLAVVSGGLIDNGAQRLGRIVEPLDLVDVFAGEEGDVHGDSGLAPETIAQADPDWVIVMDRDAAIGEGDSPAAAVFAAQEAFAGTTFGRQDQVLYLDPTFYTRESLQSYQEAYDQITEAFTA